MNYLGHLLVLPDRGLITLGNLLGDFVKGRTELIEPRDFAAGVRLHRELDRFTDGHAVVKRSKLLIGAERRRIAGVLVDVFYDHFLAQGVDVEVYRDALLPYAKELPDALRMLPGQLISNRWLGSYARVDGIADILARMDSRRRRPLGLTGAEGELVRHYESFAADCAEFYPEAVRLANKFSTWKRGSEDPRAEDRG